MIDMIDAQEPNPEEQQKIADIVRALEPLKGENWEEALGEMVDTESAPFFESKLIKAEDGMGHCGDERPIRGGIPFTKPKKFGGAAGWAADFMMFGLSRKEAVQATVKLYERRRWGVMEVHSDDHDCTTDEEVENRVAGCGQARENNVIRAATSITLEGEVTGIQQGERVSGVDLVSDLIAAGAKKIPLTDEHVAARAKVIVNDKPGTTIPTEQLYNETPAFGWDRWATTDDETRAVFNELAGTQLTRKEFVKFQTISAIATGRSLDAVRLSDDEGAGKNIVPIAA